MARAIILVLDSFGVGYADDASSFGDVDANTFINIAKRYLKDKNKVIHLPNLGALGLHELSKQASSDQIWQEYEQDLVKSARSSHDFYIKPTKGAFGYMAEISTGKDTPSGHWEMAGVPVLFDYTSADSVFQVAAHEEHFGLDNLYHYCEQVRELLSNSEFTIGRVIARPFIGDVLSNGENTFTRTGNRRDYSVLPPSTTVLDKIAQAGGQVISVGKISDIFAHQGITHKTKANGIDALIDATIKHINTADDKSLIFTNLVNFDQDFGHRRDAVGYAQALESFDKRLPEIYKHMANDDILFLTADHGCDPTWPGNDHTREFVPLLAYHHLVQSVELGQRTSFADLGQTLAELFNVDAMDYGTSFLSDLFDR